MHRRFGLGIDIEQDARIMVDVERPRAQFLVAADVIIIDEISSTHRKSCYASIWQLTFWRKSNFSLILFCGTLFTIF